MTMDAGPAAGIHDPPGHDRQELLVLTHGQSYGHNGLALPFENATVLSAGSVDDVDIEGYFEIIVIDGDSNNLEDVEALVRKALPALRPGGRILIPLGPAPEKSTVTALRPPAFAGVAWHGLRLLNGHPCAVLVSGEADRPEIAPLLINSTELLRLASAKDRDSHLPVDLFRHELAQQRAAQSRSEQALLGHLGITAQELDRARKRLQQALTLRALVKRSKLGSRLVPILRPFWHGARRLRRRVSEFFGRLSTRKN